MTNSNVRGVCVVWWEQRLLCKFCVWDGSKCWSCFCVRCDSPLCGALCIMNIQSSRARCLLFLILWGTFLLATVKWKWLEGVRQQPGQCKLTACTRGHCRTWRAPAQVCHWWGIQNQQLVSGWKTGWGTMQHAPDDVCFQDTELHSCSGEIGSVGRQPFKGEYLGLLRLIAKALLLQHEGIRFASCVFVQQSREPVSLPISPFPFGPHHCRLLWRDLNTPGIQDLANEEEGPSGIIPQYKKERSVHVVFYGEGQTSSIGPRVWCGSFPILTKLQHCLVLHMR